MSAVETWAAEPRSVAPRRAWVAQMSPDAVMRNLRHRVAARNLAEVNLAKANLPKASSRETAVDSVATAITMGGSAGVRGLSLD